MKLHFIFLPILKLSLSALLLQSCNFNGKGKTFAPSTTTVSIADDDTSETTIGSAPTIGGNLSFSLTSETTTQVTWPVSSDVETNQNSLEYKLVSAFSSSAIDTATEADAITGAHLRMD